MTIYLPLNRWVIAGAITAVIWLWFVLVGSQRDGDFDFSPAIFGFIVVIATVCLWAGLLLGTLL